MRLLAAVALLLSATTLPAAALASRPSTGTLRIVLRGQNVVTHGDLNGKGAALLRLYARTGRVCWRFSKFSGIGHPSAARIGNAPRGRDGRIVLTLGRHYEALGCTTAAKRLVTQMVGSPDAYYLTVWTKPKYPHGAIRGQL